MRPRPTLSHPAGKAPRTARRRGSDHTGPDWTSLYQPWLGRVRTAGTLASRRAFPVFRWPVSAEAKTSLPGRHGLLAADRLAHPRPAQDGVDLGAVRRAFGPFGEPREVAGVDARDLAERPADVATEVEHTAGRPTGRPTGAAGPVLPPDHASSAVVFRASLRRPESVERGVDAHHPRSRSIPGHIRMMSSCQSAVCPCYRTIICIGRDAQDDICVALDQIQHRMGPPRGSAPSTTVGRTVIGGSADRKGFGRGFGAAAHRRLRRAMTSLDAERISIVDVIDETSFALLPPCADPGFDHRSCDYWEDADRGSKAIRLDWLEPPAASDAKPPTPRPRAASANPFLADARERSANPFAPGGGGGSNPFLRRRRRGGRQSLRAPPRPETDRRCWRASEASSPRPRAGRRRAVMPRSCSSTTSRPRIRSSGLCPPTPGRCGRASCIRPSRMPPCRPSSRASRRPQAARGAGLARTLVDAVCDDLGRRGFAAVETYPEMGARPDATSAATPGFWETVGFAVAAPDDRFPVLRRELG